MTNKENIQTGLEQDARRLKERILMGVEWEDAKKAAESLQIFLDEQKWTQSAIAKKLGVSSAAISQFLKGQYKGKLSEITNKIANFLDSFYRKERHDKSPEGVETEVAKRVLTLIKQTEAFSDEDEGKIGIVVGDGGHGKSHCLRIYAKANRNTVYVELDDCMTTTMMFGEIAERLRLNPDGSLASITRRIIDHLVNRHMIIILDEASSLKVGQLNQLRQVIVIKSRCPLVLSGNSDLLKTVMQPTTRKGYESLDQFTSRLMGVLNLDAIAGEQNGGGLYSEDDIRKLYEYGGIRLTTDAVKVLQRIARTSKSGRLRTCSHIISALHTAAVAVKSGQIDGGLIVAAIEQLDLPVKARLPLATMEVKEVHIQKQVKTA